MHTTRCHENDLLDTGCKLSQEQMHRNVFSDLSDLKNRIVKTMCLFAPLSVSHAIALAVCGTVRQHAAGALQRPPGACSINIPYVCTVSFCEPPLMRRIMFQRKFNRVHMPSRFKSCLASFLWSLNCWYETLHPDALYVQWRYTFFLRHRRSFFKNRAGYFKVRERRGMNLIIASQTTQVSFALAEIGHWSSSSLVQS